MEQLLSLLNLSAVKDMPKTKGAPAGDQKGDEQFQSALENLLTQAGADEKTLSQLSARAVLSGRHSKERLGEEQEVKEIRGLKNIKDILLLSGEKKLGLKSLTVEIKQEGKPDSKLVIKTDDTPENTKEKGKPSLSPLKFLRTEPVSNQEPQKSVTLDLKELLAKLKDEAAKPEKMTEALTEESSKETLSEKKERPLPKTSANEVKKGGDEDAAHEKPKLQTKLSKEVKTTARTESKPETAGHTEDTPETVSKKETQTAEEPKIKKSDTLRTKAPTTTTNHEVQADETPGPKTEKRSSSDQQPPKVQAGETEQKQATKPEAAQNNKEPQAASSPELKESETATPDAKEKPLQTHKPVTGNPDTKELKKAITPHSEQKAESIKPTPVNEATPKQTASASTDAPLQTKRNETISKTDHPESKRRKQEKKTDEAPIQHNKASKKSAPKTEEVTTVHKSEQVDTVSQKRSLKEEDHPTRQPHETKKPAGLSDLIRSPKREVKKSETPTAETPKATKAAEQKPQLQQASTLKSSEDKPAEVSTKNEAPKETPKTDAKPQSSPEAILTESKPKKHTVTKPAAKPDPLPGQRDPVSKEQVSEAAKNDTVLKKEAPKNPTLGALLNTGNGHSKKLKKESDETKSSSLKSQAAEVKNALPATDEILRREPESINRDFISKILSKNLSAGTAMTINGGSGATPSQATATVAPVIVQPETITSTETAPSEQQTETIRNEEIRHESLKNRVASARTTVSHFAQNLKEQVQEYKAPLMKITMDLNPKNLGSVGVTLLNRGKNLHVQIHSNAQAVQLFMQNNLEFKNALTDLGYKDVQLNFSFGQGSSSNHNGGGYREQQELPSYFSQNNDNQNETEEMEIILPNLIYG